METINLYELKKLQSEFPKEKINSSKKSSDFIRQFYGDDLEIFESFFILLLDRQCNTIGYAKISQGGLVGTVVDIKLICKYVISSLADSVIICHNHPSGNTKPSQADVTITKRINEVLKMIDVTLIDHIILTNDSYFSFADEGLIY